MNTVFYHKDMHYTKLSAYPPLQQFTLVLQKLELLGHNPTPISEDELMSTIIMPWLVKFSHPTSTDDAPAE